MSTSDLPKRVLKWAASPRCEWRHVFRPLPKRWQTEGQHIETVIQVLAELALRDALLQIPVARGNDPGFTSDRFVAADGFELARLDHA